MPLFAPGRSAAAPTLPVVLDVSDASTWQAWRAMPGTTGESWAYRVVPAGGPALLGVPQVTLQVRNDPASGESQSLPVTLAHPDFLYTYFLPAKGSIATHGVRGTDLTVDATNDSTASAFTALDAVFKQVQEIKAAREAGKK